MVPSDKPSELLPDLRELVQLAKKSASEISQQADSLHVVAFVDLKGSTEAKLRRGNSVAVREALAFTELAASIATKHGGHVLKTLGDGALLTFADPVAACRAVLNLRFATYEHLELEMTAGLTSGRPLRLTFDDGSHDFLGDVVDRAARVQALATPGQVLIDAALHQQIRGDLAGLGGWEVDAAPRRAHAKGVGPIDLYEIALSGHWTLKKELATPFDVIANGRPSVSEKLALIRNAKSEIVEIGIGLTSFAQYFTGQKPDEFRDPIRTLVRGGVNLKCFAINLDYSPGRAWLAEQPNTDYVTEAEIARRRLEDEARYHRTNQSIGRMSYYTFDRVPEFWCLGVDVEDPVDGRMFFAPYLMDVPRSSTPVIQLSRLSNATLFEKYLTSIRAVRAASTESP